MNITTENISTMFDMQEYDTLLFTLYKLSSLYIYTVKTKRLCLNICVTDVYMYKYIYYVTVMKSTFVTKAIM